VTKRNLTPQKQPQTHQFLSLFYQHFSTKSDTKIIKSFTALFMRGWTNITPKTPPSDTQEQNQPSATKSVPNTATPVPNAPLTKDHHPRPTMHQENHPMFAYPAVHETFFNNNDVNNDHKKNNDKPPQVSWASPDALTSFYKNRPYKNTPTVFHHSTLLSNSPSLKLTTIQCLHGQPPHCLQYFTMEMPCL
jgi:hypothetical protein